MWIPCVCGNGYETKLPQIFHVCPSCGHTWNLRPDMRLVPEEIERQKENSRNEQRKDCDRSRD